MPSEEAEHASPMEVTPKLGKGTLDTWRFHARSGARTLSRGKPTKSGERGGGQTREAGAYAYQRLNLAEDGKARSG